MDKSRNKKSNSNSASKDDLNLDNNYGSNIDADEQFQKNENLDEDYIDESDMSEEIEQKIDLVYEKNKKNINNKENNAIFQDIKEEKKKKEKYDKKIMKNNFNDYFEASSNKIEDYYEVNYSELNKYDLKIDQYTEYYKLLEKGKIFPSLKLQKNKNNSQEQENNNIINQWNLFNLIYELIYQDFNIFLYGFGSKINLIYEFIKDFQMKYNYYSNVPLYIISCNLNNSEVSMKVIINKIESCLMTEFEKYYGKDNEKKFSSESTHHGQIIKINTIYKKILNKFKKKADEEEEEEKDSSLEENEKEQEKIKIKKEKGNEDENEINNDIFDDYMPFRILLIIHNIGSSTGQSKLFQENLSELAYKLSFVNLVVTCENLAIPYYWTSEVKDKFKFCFLKFNTYEPYDTEIDENNSIKGGNNLKGGEGLREILSSFTETQNKLIKEIAILTLKNDYDSLTQKGLIEYFVKTGKGIATDIQKLETLLLEAIDHEIISLKISSVNNKEIYKMNFDRNIIEKIAEGEFTQK